MIVPADIRHIIYVLQHLRAADRDELLAMSDADAPDQLVQRFEQLVSRDHTIILAALTDQGEPAAIFGVAQMFSGVGVAFAFGTPRWPMTVRELFHFCRRKFTPDIVELGFHRIECRVMAGRPDVDRFLFGLDFRPEMALPMAGRHQEDFVQWAWLGGASHVRH